MMWKKIKASRYLNGNVLAVLKKLAAWREITARTENQPRKWILKDNTLIDMARLLPADREALAGINGMNKQVLNKHGDALLDIIATGKE